MGLHNDQACARIGSHMGCQADERTENLSEFPRRRAEIQGRFAGAALAPQPNRRCCLTVVETHFVGNCVSAIHPNTVVGQATRSSGSSVGATFSLLPPS